KLAVAMGAVSGFSAMTMLPIEVTMVAVRPSPGAPPAGTGTGAGDAVPLGEGAARGRHAARTRTEAASSPRVQGRTMLMGFLSCFGRVRRPLPARPGSRRLR